jgi:transcription elongation factor Elf1
MHEEDLLYEQSSITTLQMSETKKEIFACNKCGKTFNSESQMNAHKVSVHSVAGGEQTMR